MKINKKSKVIEKLLITGILIIMLCSFVSAFAVISPYTGSEVPLELSPGQEKTFAITFRNSDIQEGLNIGIKILEGMNIASLKKSSVSVPYTETASVDIVVKIPTGAKIGDKYKVVYESKQSAIGPSNGTVSFTETVTRNFEVNIVPEKPIAPAVTPGISTTTIIVLVIAIIVVIAIIWFLIKKKK